jgi:membrane protease subunit HflK
MAWNTPGSGGSGSGGSGNNGNRNPWKPRSGGSGSGGGIGEVIERLRGLFGGGGGGANPLRWVAIGLGILILFSSFQLIGEQQRGVVLRFGQFARVMDPGPNFKWPWPIESVTKVNATQVNNFSNTVSVLTRDENIVRIQFNVQYRISDPRLYLYGTRASVAVLEQAAQSAVREQVGRSDFNAVINQRGPLAEAARVRLQDSLGAYKTGLVVSTLELQDARPPEEVQPAFDAVNGAQQVRESLINEAQAYAAKVVPEARGEAARRRTTAEGYKSSIIAKAEGDAARFSLLQAQYKDAPDVTRKRLWLDTVQQVLADNRKVIGGDSRQLIYVPMAGAGAASAPSAAQAALPSEIVMPSVESTPSGSARSAVRTPRPAGREEPQR